VNKELLGRREYDGEVGFAKKRGNNAMDGAPIIYPHSTNSPQDPTTSLIWTYPYFFKVHLVLICGKCVIF